MMVSPASRRRRWPVLLGLLGVLLAATTACSTRELLDAPRCQGGSSIIATQSVPTAELIPCFNRLPEGWSYSTVDIDEGGTVVELDSDRAGTGAATLRFDDSCSIGDAVQVPSDLDGADRFDFVERLEPGFRARTYYLFEGGCVSWRFDFDNDASATESVAIEGAVMLVSRDDIDANIRETFIDTGL